MSDAKNIDFAYRLIEGYVGEGELPPATDIDELIADINEWMSPWDANDLAADLQRCGAWAVEIALKRLRDSITGAA